MKTKKRYLLVLVFVFLFYAFLNVPNTYAIYRDTYSTTINLSISTPMCTIIFESNGGTAVGNASVECGDPIGSLPMDITKTNNTFDGWYLDENFNTRASVDTIIEEDNTVLYARWIPNGRVARIGNTYYTTLAQAINAVPQTGTKTTIQLLQDVTETISISNKKNVELDLQSYVLSNSGTPITNSGMLTIKSGTVSCSGTSACITNNQYASLYVNGGTISNTGSGQGIYNNGGLVTMSGNPTISNVSSSLAAVQNINKGELYIHGGTIIAENYSAVYTNNNSTLVVGVDDDSIDTASPAITGSTYGIQADKSFKFYDGIVKGKTKQFNNDSYVTIKSNTIRNDGVDGDYKTTILEYYNPGTAVVTFDANGGVSSATPREVYLGDGVGTLPKATKTDFNFTGWYTLAEGGDKITPETVINEDVTFYAHYIDIVCKRASEETLHTHGTTTYGSVQTGDTMVSGNAFDCDVNGDGTFDPVTERFYYLTTDEYGNALLIFYNYTSAENNYVPSCGTSQVSYSNNNKNILGPNLIYQNLPPTTLWTNVSLMNDGERVILNDQGGFITNGGVNRPFTYTNKAARMITTQEVMAACGISTINQNGLTNLPTSCRFLFENVGPACDEAAGRNTYWIETPKANSDVAAFRIQSENTSQYVMGYTSVANGHAAAKPVIEVPLGQMFLEIDEQEAQQAQQTQGSAPLLDVAPSLEPQTSEDENSNAPVAQTVEDTTSDIMSPATIETPLVEENNEEILSSNPPASENVDKDNMSIEAPKLYDTGYRGEIKVYKYNAETEEVGEEDTEVVINDGYISNMNPNEVYYWVAVEDSNTHGLAKQDE